MSARVQSVAIQRKREREHARGDEDIRCDGEVTGTPDVSG